MDVLRNFLRTGGRRLAALAVRWLVAGSVPATFACPGQDGGAAGRGLSGVFRRLCLSIRRRADGGRTSAPIGGTGSGGRCGKHEPGRLRVRLPWAHGLAALLLVAVAALSAAPVQAQTTPLWSTTMTVGENTSQGRGYEISKGHGSVGNDSFSFAGTTVQVSALVSGGTVRLNLSFTGTITVAQLETLILEWAGETVPLADNSTISRQRQDVPLE